jgi:hypothetical protein
VLRVFGCGSFGDGVEGRDLGLGVGRCKQLCLGWDVVAFGFGSMHVSPLLA